MSEITWADSLSETEVDPALSVRMPIMTAGEMQQTLERMRQSLGTQSPTV